ncbi:MAG: phospholipase D-like domain-containing protein [Rhabdochlamydiaceae bacterium]|nr:phospholipase D-like domain-containing protein [Candidatus Amphrikana amoebophyrae]
MKWFLILTTFATCSLFGDEVMGVFFSSEGAISPKLVELIDQEKESIHGAVYHFTDPKVATALIAAKKRGVKVELITHKGKLSKALDDMKKGGVEVSIGKLSNKRGLMHHKFLLFKNNKDNCSLVWTGSYNITKSGSNSNFENVVILKGESTFQKYWQEFTSIPK